MKRVLIVDDDRAMGEMIRQHLVRHGHEPIICERADQALQALSEGDVDVVVTDLQMRGMDGLALCTRIVADHSEVPVILITAFGSMDTAIAAIRAGAYDFIPKPFEIDNLLVALERAIERRALRREVKELRSALEKVQQLEELLGESPAMQRLYSLIERIRDSDAPTLITGESGTGKELVARALHRRSRRASGPFVSVNCAAMPEALFESELFGHVRGAFTDARGARAGLFAQADGGVLFLDEIGELPLPLQPKLLRALQEHRIRPVGSDSELALDVRVIAATNRDLQTAVEEQRFREDLFYRIHVLHLELPPLRTRGRDILVLAQAFVERAAALARRSVTGLSPEAARKLLDYPWPGNVRELQNCIERAVAMGEHVVVEVADLPERVRNHAHSHVVVASDDPSELATMDEVEKRYIHRVLDAVGGKKSEAARILGFDRTTLYRKLEKYKL